MAVAEPDRAAGCFGGWLARDFGKAAGRTGVEQRVVRIRGRCASAAVIGERDDHDHDSCEEQAQQERASSPRDQAPYVTF